MVKEATMKRILILALLLILPSGVFAQQVEENKSEEKPEPKHNHDTYVKMGFNHWEGKVWDFNYNLNGVNFDIETYFNTTHLQLSGWSIGYRKDDLRYSDSGHLLNFKVFRTFDLKVVDAKIGGGGEWGMSAFVLDQTRFENTGDDSIRYRHVYPVRNSDAPYIGTMHDGVLYPIGEVSLLKRKSIFLIEGGIRESFMRFGNDGYTVRNDISTYSFQRKRLPLMTVFVNVGIKIGP